MIASQDFIGRQLIAGWIGIVRRFPRLVLLLALVASVGAVAYAANTIEINSDVTEMMSDELEFRRNEIALKQAFPQTIDNFAVIVDAPSAELADSAAERLAAALEARSDRFEAVFYPEADPFFRRNGLLYLDIDELQSLSDSLAESQSLLSKLREDPSLRGFAEVMQLAIDEGGPETLERMAPILAEVAETSERVAAGEEVRLSWRRAVMQADDTAESLRRFILVLPIFDYDTLEPATEAVEAIRSIATELGLDDEPGLRVRVLGSMIMFEDELRSVLKDTQMVGLLSASLVLVLLLLGLRSLRLVVASLITLVAGLVWTFGFATLAIGELNMISVAFAVLFIGLSVDFGIHFSLRYQEARAAGSEEGAALRVAGGGVGGALTLSAVAAAIGFFSFLPTSYRGVAELGLIAGTGMFVALFANLTVLPALLCVLPSRRPARPGSGVIGAWFRGLVERNARLVLAAALILGGAALLTLPFARFDDDPLNLRDPNSESVATLLELLDDPRVEPYDAVVVTGNLTEAAALAERLEALPEVREALALTDLVPDDQEEKLLVIDDMAIFLGPLLDAPAAAAVPEPGERRAAARQLGDLAQRLEGEAGASGARLAAALSSMRDDPAALERLERALLGHLPGELNRLATLLEAETVELEDLPELLRRRLLAEDGRAQVEIYPSEDLRDPEARVRFVTAVRSVAPGASGDPIGIVEGGAAVRDAFREAGVYAFAMILLLLLAVLRSLRDTLLIMAPLALAGLLTVAATVVVGQPFNLANVIVLPLLMGLGVAFGIQIVLRHRMEGDGKLLGTSTPRAVAFSGLTTIGSFGSLALSSHLGTASMGLLLLIAISLTMVSMLLVLPALLATLRPPRTAAPVG